MIDLQFQFNLSISEFSNTGSLDNSMINCPAGGQPLAEKLRTENWKFIMKDLWSLKRQFLEHCEIEKGQSLLTIENYGRYIDRFLTWLEDENHKSQITNHSTLAQASAKTGKQIPNSKSKINKIVSSSSFKTSGDLENKISNTKYTTLDTKNSDITGKEKIQIFPEDITKEIIRNYRLYINRLYDKKGRELKSSTQNHHILALRAFLRYLSMQGIKVISPDQISLAKTGERKINYLTAEEYMRLLLIPKDNYCHKAILEILFSTGMRVSELIWLNITDVNFERGEIVVLGKGKKVRVVFLSESAIESLVKYLVKRGALQVMSNVKCQMSNKITNDKMSNKTNAVECIIPDASKKQPLFLSGRNRRVNVRGIERMVQKYAKTAGISRNVSPHTLRHTFATDLLIAGADIRSVQSLLGHSNISTTQVYTHVTDQHLREVHQKYHNINTEESTRTGDTASHTEKNNTTRTGDTDLDTEVK